MATKRFSKKELYFLRNEIPIHILIEKGLGIPAQVTDGTFRFLCPICNEFNTAINPATNLARCFNCEKNFNTIDLSMLIRSLDFVGAIRFLKDYQDNKIDSQKFNLNKRKKTRQVYINNAQESESVNERILMLEEKVDFLIRQIENMQRS